MPIKLAKLVFQTLDEFLENLRKGNFQLDQMLVHVDVYVDD